MWKQVDKFVYEIPLGAKEGMRVPGRVLLPKPYSNKPRQIRRWSR